jgi:oligosaccharide repeat unit polymerase
MRILLVVGLLVALLLIWRLANQRLYNDSFSPFNLLFYFWITPFILCFTKLSGLQTGITGYAATIISVSTTILIVTCLLPAALASPRLKRAVKVGHTTTPTQIHSIWVLCFYLLTTVALYFAEFSGRDVPLVTYILGDASDPNLHTLGKDSRLQVLAAGTQVAAIFVFQLWLLEKGRKRRIFYLSLALLLVALGIIKASKSDIYMPLLSFAALFYYRQRASNIKLQLRYKVIVVLALLAVISITSIRLGGIGLVGSYADLIDFSYTSELGPALSEVVAIAYGYTSVGFQNFTNYVESHSLEFRIGSSLFRPILSLLMMGDVANTIGVPVDEWNVISDAANTGTFLTSLYIEGGILFCFLGSFLYGSFVNVIYHLHRSSHSLRFKLLYVAIIFPWTWLFFTNGFSVLSVYINLFYVLILSKLCIRTRGTGRPLASSRMNQVVRDA